MKPGRFALRKLLQFRLRTLLVVVTAICAWLAWHLHCTERQREAAAAIRDLGGWVYYDYEFPTGDYLWRAPLSPQPQPRVPPWLLDRLGMDFFYNVVGVNMVYDERRGKRQDNVDTTDDALEYLPAFPRLRLLLLHGRQVSDDGMRFVAELDELEGLYMWNPHALTDAGVAHLGRLRKLRLIHIDTTSIGDASLKLFGEMPQLTNLSLQYNQFSDEGVKHLERLPRLESLWICTKRGMKSRVTDACVPSLAKLRTLKELAFQDTEISPVGVASLEKALPGCKLIP